MAEASWQEPSRHWPAWEPFAPGQFGQPLTLQLLLRILIARHGAFEVSREEYETALAESQAGQTMAAAKLSGDVLVFDVRPLPRSLSASADTVTT